MLVTSGKGCPWDVSLVSTLSGGCRQHRSAKILIGSHPATLCSPQAAAPRSWAVPHFGGSLSGCLKGRSLCLLISDKATKSEVFIQNLLIGKSASCCMMKNMRIKSTIQTFSMISTYQPPSFEILSKYWKLRKIISDGDFSKMFESMLNTPNYSFQNGLEMKHQKENESIWYLWSETFPLISLEQHLYLKAC